MPDPTYKRNVLNSNEDPEGRAQRGLPVHYNAVKVFTGTTCRERRELGERVTAWIHETTPFIVDTVVRQSSDREYHCISITIFYVRTSALKEPFDA